MVSKVCFGHELSDDDDDELRDGTTAGVALRARTACAPSFGLIDGVPGEIWVDSTFNEKIMLYILRLIVKSG